MKNKQHSIFKILIILSVMVCAATFFQGEGPHEPEPKGGSARPYSGISPAEPEGGLLTSHGRMNVPPDLNGANAISQLEMMPHVATGAPGLTFSHAQTFGETERAYFDDIQHFAYPFGVATDGANVWIADSRGNRAVKFNFSGTYQNLTIGSAGFREYYEDDGVSLEWILDVGVDSGGNIWLVDGGAHHVAKFNSNGEYQSGLGTQWETGSDNNHFDRPVGIAFDASGNIYVSDRNNHRVQIYDNTGAYLTTLGSYGSGNFNFDRPEHIAIYGNNLYVSDNYNHRVQIYNISNPLSIVYVATLGSTDNPGSSNSQFNRPCGVAANASYIFVADANNNRIQIFNNSGPYGWAATLGSFGSGNSQFIWPQDVAVDSLGNLYVADNENHRIQQFNSLWVYLRTYGTTGVPYLTDQQHYNTPSGVAIGSDGSIYISESRGQRIVKIKADGTPLWKFGESGVTGGDNNHFCWPEGIAVGPDGRVFVADSCNDRIQVFNSIGGYLGTVGSYGAGNGQFDSPQGVALDKTGNLYVADTGNCRFQVFNSSLSHIASFGSCGAGDNQFLWPTDIAVDSAGRIYVVDNDQQRVKLYSSSRVYLRSIGTGVSGYQYDQLRNPVAIAVDGQDRVYIADNWGSYIKVYDKDGKFLDCLENGSGSFQGIFRQADGLAVDTGGSLFLADQLSHQVKRYFPGAYPGWRQVNVTGFGSYYNWGVWSMTVFSNTLLASTINWSDYGAELFRFENGDWTQVMNAGFGDPNNIAIDSFEEFNGKLYAGTANETSSGYTNGGQIWRSATASDGSWEKVVDNGFGSISNGEVMSMKTYDGYLYAGTWSWDIDDHGAEIYRSDTGDLGSWTKVFSDTIPSHDIANAVMIMEVFSDTLYAGLSNWDSAAELWKTTDGNTWTQANTDGFGDPDNRRIVSLAEFDGRLYAGVQNYDTGISRSNGAQIWRSDNGTSWEKVADGGFGDPNNWAIGGLIVYKDRIYAIVNNYNYSNPKQMKGIEVWRSTTGDSGDWERVAWHSFGAELASADHYWGGNFTVYDNLLYIGTSAWWISGGRIWSYLPYSTYLPLVTR